MKFYEKIRLLREEKGKTQYAVHKELGIGIETVRKYERPDPETFPQAADQHHEYFQTLCGDL